MKMWEIGADVVEIDISKNNLNIVPSPFYLR
jgi:hypothetical protein